MNRTFTYQTASLTDQAIASSKGVRVFQIIVSGSGGAAVATLEKLGTTDIVCVVQAASGATQVVNFGDEGLLISGGVQLTTAANTLCTLVHSPGRTS